MAPRKTRAVPTTAAESNSNTITSGPILLVNGFLDSEECRALVKFVDDQSLELTPPKKKGEAVRVNYRVSLTSADIAKQLFNLLTPHLPPFPYPLSRRTSGTSTRPVHSFNPNIRLYKYTPGQHFGPHYDDSVRDPLTGAESEWTVLLYITGIEDGVKGGETLFYHTQKGRSREVITPSLTRGTVLLHRHGHECLLHEGSPVVDGVKYILRTDLMFRD